MSWQVHTNLAYQRYYTLANAVKSGCTLKLLEFVIEIVCFYAFLENIDIKIHRISISVIVFYGCKTWSLTVKEESRPRLFDNKVLENIWT
jgi:hypothetical protein